MIKQFVMAFILLAGITCSSSAFADDPLSSSSKNGNFKKGTFSNNNSYSKGGKALTPPDPTTGTGGNPIPISPGIIILAIGSTIYFGKRIRDEIHQQKSS